MFHSGSFAGSAVNWSAFTKEAAVIFKAILQMTFYLMDSDVIVHTDYKLLKKFIEAVTAHSRVNDWSFQIHAICKSITFQHIKGSANVLVDILSRLKYYDLYEPPTPEKPGYEFNKPKVEYEPLTPQSPI